MVANRISLHQSLPSSVKDSFLQPPAPLTNKKPSTDKTMTLLFTIQLLFYIQVMLPFVVALPMGNPAFSLPNDGSLRLDSSLSFLDGAAQLDPTKRDFTKAGIRSPPKPLSITTADAKANALSERSTRPLEQPEKRINPITKSGEHVMGVGKQERPQSVRRNLESSAPPTSSSSRQKFV